MNVTRHTHNGGLYGYPYGGSGGGAAGNPRRAPEQNSNGAGCGGLGMQINFDGVRICQLLHLGYGGCWMPGCANA